MYSRFSAVAAEVERALAMYRFDEAAGAVYQFFWGEFCDWYVELVKVRLDFGGEDDAAARLTLHALASVYEAALRLLSPFMPFLTEEIWHALYAVTGQEAPAKSIALTRFPLAGDFPRDPEAEETMTLPAGSASAEALSGSGSKSTARFDLRVVYQRVVDVPAERERLTKELAKLENGVTASQKQLGNEAFMAKAPAHIVEGLKRQAAETGLLYEKARTALAELD